MKYCYLFLGLLLLMSCAPDENQKQRMIAFDGALIPVWYFASNDQFAQAQQAMPLLEEEWYALQADYLDIPGPRIAWEDTYKCIRELMTATIAAIEHQEAENAKEYLESVNFELMNLRFEYSIEHDFDKVWEFKLNLDFIHQLIDDYYYLIEPAEFDCLLEELNYIWKEVEHTALAKHPQWDHLKIKESKRLKDDIRKKLHLLTESVLNRDLETEELAYEFAPIDHAVTQLICLFGNFEILNTTEDATPVIVTTVGE